MVASERRHLNAGKIKPWVINRGNKARLPPIVAQSQQHPVPPLTLDEVQVRRQGPFVQG